MESPKNSSGAAADQSAAVPAHKVGPASAPAAPALSATDIERVNAIKLKAAKLFRAGQYASAAIECTQAITIDPSNHTLYSNRSGAFAALNNYSRALRDALKCIALEPAFAKGYFRAGFALESLLRYREALQRYDEGLAVDPESSELRIAASSLRAVIGELEANAGVAGAGTAVDGAAPITVESKSGGAGKTAKKQAGATGDEEDDEEDGEEEDDGDDDDDDDDDDDGTAEQDDGAAASGRTRRRRRGRRTTAAAALPDTDKFARLRDWLLEGGARFPSLYLKYYSEGYRGVHAATHVAPNTMVLYVPHKCIITSEVARASEIGCRITESHLVLRSKHTYLAAFLLQERDKGAGSFWHPYISILPARFSSVPLYFTDAELAWLEGSFTLGKIADRMESLQGEYDALRRAIPAFARWTFDEFVWARLAVITRIFGLVIDGVKTDGLVPYADMLNHKLPRETRWLYDDSCGGFTITSFTSIERGAQVFDSYGRKCNNRFFINYGFTVLDNPDNEAVLRVAIDETDRLLAEKLACLPGNFTGRREYQVPAGARDAKSRDLFGFMRLVAANEAELETIRGSKLSAPDLDSVTFISPRNEAAALAALRTAARAALQRYPTTLAADSEVLASGALAEYSNEWNAVVTRRGEKLVLQWFVDLADRCIPLLDLPRLTVLSFICRQRNTRARQHLQPPQPGADANATATATPVPAPAPAPAETLPSSNGDGDGSVDINGDGDSDGAGVSPHAAAEAERVGADLESPVSELVIEYLETVFSNSPRRTDGAKS